MTINERMAAAGVPGRPYTLADMLDWAAAELDRLEAQLNFSNATITELLVQLEKMAAERDSLKQQLAAARHQLVLQQYQYETSLKLAQKGVRDAHEREKYIKKQLDTLKFVMENNPPEQEADHAEHQ